MLPYCHAIPQVVGRPHVSPGNVLGLDGVALGCGRGEEDAPASLRGHMRCCPGCFEVQVGRHAIIANGASNLVSLQFAVHTYSCSVSRHVGQGLVGGHCIVEVPGSEADHVAVELDIVRCGRGPRVGACERLRQGFRLEWGVSWRPHCFYWRPDGVNQRAEPVSEGGSWVGWVGGARWLLALPSEEVS